MPATSFPWGSNPFPESIFMLALLFAGAVGWALLSTAPTSPPGIKSGMALENIRTTALACLAWVLVYYNGLGGQVFIKMTHKNFSVDAAKLAERTAINMLEQAPVFFVTLWLHCAYVNAAEAGYLGLAYVVIRIFYQLTYSLYGTFTVLVEFTTQPAYIIIYYFSFSVLGACIDVPITSYLPTGPLVIPVLAVSNLLLFMAGWNLPSGGPMAYLNNAANPVKEKQ